MRDGATDNKRKENIRAAEMETESCAKDRQVLCTVKDNKDRM